jgi:hypothetical protein
VDGVLWINTGSVGRPDDGDPRACYAVLQIGAKRIQVTHHRVEYDVERAVAAIREHNLPEVFAQMILSGRNMEAALTEGNAAAVPQGDEGQPAFLRVD